MFYRTTLTLAANPARKQVLAFPSTSSFMCARVHMGKAQSRSLTSRTSVFINSQDTKLPEQVKELGDARMKALLDSRLEPIQQDLGRLRQLLGRLEQQSLEEATARDTQEWCRTAAIIAAIVWTYKELKDQGRNSKADLKEQINRAEKGPKEQIDRVERNLKEQINRAEKGRKEQIDRVERNLKRR